MKTVEVIGVHARARCYNGGAALAAAPEVDVTDPLGLEAAFDSSFSIPKTSKPKATAGDDSLGLEEAFDVAFGDLAAGDEDQSDSTEPNRKLPPLLMMRQMNHELVLHLAWTTRRI